MAAEIAEPVIGINLGTTYTRAAVWRGTDVRYVELIRNELDDFKTPSCVAFTENNRLFGEAAVNQTIMNPLNTIFDAKRFIGRRFSDVAIQEDIKLLPFKVVDGSTHSGKGDVPMVIVDYMGEEKKFRFEEITAMTLAKLKAQAESFLGTAVKKAVISVPAYFNDSQRRATKDAGMIAGLDVVRIINETTATALTFAWGIITDYYRNRYGKTNMLVFDFGGGTLDVSLFALELCDVKVIAISGDTHLGGADFDNILVSRLIEEFKRRHNEDISKDPKALAKLRVASEKAKKELSDLDQTDIDIDCLFDGIDFSATITRADFEMWSDDLFNRCVKTVEQCLEGAGMEKDDVHEIILLGGSSWIPKVQQKLQDYFDGKEITTSMLDDEFVTAGTALLTAPGNDYNPNTVVEDVAPLSLGIDVSRETISVMIPNNTTIPFHASKLYQTNFQDETDEFIFRVIEGERLNSQDNLLGEFKLSGFPVGPDRATQFYIDFDIDEDGILTVSAKGTQRGERNQIKVTNTCGWLSEEEIQRMTEEAENYKAQDEKNKESKEVENKQED